MNDETEAKSEPQAAVPQKGFFSKIFYHQNFNVLAGLLGIVGTILAIFFYEASIREPNLTYYISPTRAAFVQKKNLNNFSVTYQGLAITGDLSSAEIQIWNDGKAAIHKADILKPITLKTPNGEPFYTEYFTNNDVVGFELLNSSNMQSGVLTMDWKILQHNDGVKLQVIYGGSVDLPLTLNGVIEGQQQGITHYQSKNVSWKNKLAIFFIAPIILLVGLFLLGISLLKWVIVPALVRIKLKTIRRYFFENAFITFALIFPFIGVFLYLYSLHTNGIQLFQAAPPLGF
jgi:hypothetical protein